MPDLCGYGSDARSTEMAVAAHACNASVSFGDVL